MTDIRVGLGVDVHPFSDDPDRACVIGGVTLDGERGLAGHSDADAVAHAIADAIAGAAGLGDIGQHFPDTDPQWRGADSLGLLAEMSGRAKSTGWSPVNVDCTIVAEEPRISRSRELMAERLSRAVGAPVNVKATRPERLGSLGRVEGLACFAVALLERVPTSPSDIVPEEGS
ncbi:MAG TPA: 2-C-methyl-D-erythritol 2,4-cyclodiphosphate synthase [Acidimicrobiales bacterium]|nr:2-C-methyl-D-erythritol 2,4-cyclodiphosphate synthase [Acidimicrobiales bacterium]